MCEMVYAVRDEMRVPIRSSLSLETESGTRRQEISVVDNRALSERLEERSRIHASVTPAKIRMVRDATVATENLACITATVVALRRQAFHLYETFGLPLDFMMDAARDAGIQFDLTGFEKARAEEQARARASWKGGTKQSASPVFRELPKTEFEGYRKLTSRWRARFWPSSRMVRVCRRRMPEMRWKWSSITPAFMPIRAGRSAIRAGSTPTITTRSLPM